MTDKQIGIRLGVSGEKESASAVETVGTRGASAFEKLQTSVQRAGNAAEFAEAKVKRFGRGVNDAAGAVQLMSPLLGGLGTNFGALATGVGNVSDVFGTLSSILLKNPIGLARRVMDKSAHVLISGMGAFEFAHLERVPLEEDQYFYDQFRYDQWKKVQGTDAVRGTTPGTLRGRELFGHALGRSATQIVAFLVNATKGTPIASFIGAPELLSALTDITSFSSGRATTYSLLLVFYTVVVMIVVWLCGKLRVYLENRQARADQADKVAA